MLADMMLSFFFSHYRLFLTMDEGSDIRAMVKTTIIMALTHIVLRYSFYFFKNITASSFLSFNWKSQNISPFKKRVLFMRFLFFQSSLGTSCRDYAATPPGLDSWSGRRHSLYH